MPQLLLWFAFCCLPRTIPTYSASTVLHAANNQPVLAPNTFVALYGNNLAFTTRALRPSDMEGTFLPVYLTGTGVNVTVDGIAAALFYVSPNQINFLVPSIILPGHEAKIRVVTDGITGPDVSLRIEPTAPGLFLLDPETPITVTLDGAVVRAGTPVKPGTDVILYATGLGLLQRNLPYLQVTQEAIRILNRKDFQILLNGEPVDDSRIRYVGTAPGYGGLYQINFWIPDSAPPTPEIRLKTADSISPAGIKLPVM